MWTLFNIASAVTISSKQDQLDLVSFATSPQCDDKIRAAAREELVRSNLRMAISVAKKHQRDGIELDDLIAAAVQGVITAIDKFDTEKSNSASFSSFARFWAVAACQEWVQESSGAVRLGSRAGRKMWASLSKARRTLDAQGLEHTPENLATLLDLPADDIAELLPLVSGHVQSMEAPVFDQDGATFGQCLPQDAPLQDEKMVRTQGAARLRAILDDFAATLSERDQLVLRRRILADFLGEDKITPACLGISKQRLSQLDKRVADKLRGFIQNNLDPSLAAQMLGR